MEIKHLALGMVNAYLVKTGGDWFLIDTGVAMGRAKFEQSIAREGVAPADIKLVIITHGDLDHIGNCAYLQKKYGLKIAVHDADAELCRTGTTNFNRRRKASPLSKVLRPLLFTLIIKPMMKKFPLEPFEPAIILSDGQHLMDYGFNATVFHIPGHTMGSIGILTADGDFFSGDTINNRKKPAVADTVENETALAKSLEKIRAMRIVNVFPGHGKPFPMAELTF
jgi:glyoxylase-like metal-dependent hydrolase (beta-lactamase superfamily II)